MKATFFFVALLLHPYLTLAQTEDSSEPVQFFRGGLHFPPLIANTYEPRVGFVFQAESSDLRLDIGNSIDILELNVFSETGRRLTFGADFFTWTALRQDENFHFPVDAVDYLFGVNLSYSEPVTAVNTLQGRLRWSHISAHLVDGRFDKANNEWREGQLPRVYSREYIELTAAYDIDDILRPYVGITYVYHIDPAHLGKMIYQAGVESTYPHPDSSSIHPYIAYDMRLVDISGYEVYHSFQVGVKIGTWRGNGINVFIAYYSGNSVHGEYFDMTSQYWGPGFKIDF